MTAGCMDKKNDERSAFCGHERMILLDPKLVTLLHVTPSDERAAWRLFEQRADKSYSFTDCTSFIVMRRQKIGLALTLDHHFAQEGFRTVPA